MRAAFYEKYVPPKVVQLPEIAISRPKEGEMLIKINAATVTSDDTGLRASRFPPLFWLLAKLIFGLFKSKKMLGHEFSGEVQKVGSAITYFKPRDLVFGTTTMRQGGSHAEYVYLPERWKQGVIGFKSASLTFAEVTAIPIGAMTTLFLLRKGAISPEQHVLIYGASGSVGSSAVQLARHFGA